MIFSVLHQLSTIIAFIVGCFCYKRLTKPLKLLFFLIMVMVIVEAYSYYRFYLGMYNQWQKHIYMIVEFALFFLVFRSWQNDKRIIKAINGLIPVFTLFCIVNYFFCDPVILIYKGKLVFNSWALYNYVPIKIAVVFYTAISAYTLKLLFENDKGDIIEIPAFWVSSSLLLFSSISIVYFVVVATESKIVHEYMTIIINTMSMLNVVTNSLYAFSFFIQWKYNRDCPLETNKTEYSNQFL